MDSISNVSEKLNNPEKQISSQEQSVRFNRDTEVKREIKENPEDAKIVSHELMKEIEMMQMDEGMKKEAAEKANKIKVFADEDKLKQLLEVARERGVVYAIRVAKEMNEPYILDLLHDILAKEGYYKNFVKQ